MRCARFGITGDQRVATFMWNNAEHLTAYVAIPSMGAVMHTLNIRLFARTDRLHRQRGRGPGDRRRHVAGRPAGPRAAAAGDRAHRDSGRRGRFDALTAPARPCCATTRSCRRNRPVRLARYRREVRGRDVLHQRHHRTIRKAWSTATVRATCTRWRCAPETRMGVAVSDKVLPIVPMFHANAWGLPYARADGRRRSGDAGPLPRRQVDGRPDRDTAPDRGRRRPDDLERRDALPGQASRATTSRRCGWWRAAGRRCRCR